ncbi:unnamed protein product [Dovyalis caffra]|uniref:Uncharacterized protein n=1 Tax=Dovyalis caffra TaxID=77055 RepID=A0AAV1RBS7_9ROSI|nr:unnamed protein product [Dovyalis caffra]
MKMHMLNRVAKLIEPMLQMESKSHKSTELILSAVPYDHKFTFLKANVSIKDGQKFFDRSNENEDLLWFSSNNREDITYAPIGHEKQVHFGE